MRDLTGLKTGDEVIIYNSNWNDRGNISKGTVKRVTPTGLIRVNYKTDYGLQEDSFNKNGRERGATYYWNASYIERATPELLEKFEKQELLSKINGHPGTNNLTVAEMKTIAKLLDKAERRGTIVKSSGATN